MKIEAGIFDLGKVVVQADDKVFFDDIKSTVGLDDAEVKKVIDDINNLIRTGKITEEVYLANLYEKKNVSNGPRDLLVRTFKRDFSFIDETVELLLRLRKMGVRLAALSNTSPQHIQFMIEKGTFDYFDVNVLSSDVGYVKPDPKIYELTLKELGVNPNQTFFTDDREENLPPAQDLGIEVILFENPRQLKANLSKLGLVV